MNDADMVKSLERGGYYQSNGHFLLASQKHSDTYVQVRVALMDSEISAAFASAMAGELAVRGCSLIAASTIGGLLLASKTADNLGLPLLVGRQVSRQVEWVNLGTLPKRALHNVILVDDVLTTGATLHPSIASLEALGANVTAVGVAVDRSSEGVTVRARGDTMEVFSLLRLPLKQWDETSCHICSSGKPLINLSNPEEDYVSVLLSMPERADMVLDGYGRVFRLQDDSEQAQALDGLRPWIPSLLAGLPKWRVGEDSGLVQFVRAVTAFTTQEFHRRVLIELVGHLLTVTNIRVESRRLGCAVVVGNREHLLRFFASESPLQPARGIAGSGLKNWHRLLPYFDALLETDHVFLFDRSGDLLGVRHLSRVTEIHQSRGTQLLREVTATADAVGFLVRRERKAVYVYRDGKLSNMAELSEKTGVWEFSTPGPHVDDIENELPGISPALETVLEVCREMVTRGFGGLFVVGDRAGSLRHDPPKVAVLQQPLRFVGTREAAEIAKLDGAVFVSREGELEQATVIIRNAETENLSTAVEVERSRRPGGSRSQTAHLTSVECPAAAVVMVSQNGIIEVHVRGRSWPVGRAITGVLR